MASVKTLFLGICLSAWRITTADVPLVPQAENVRWVSLDFTTILTWTTKPSNYTYTVVYSSDGIHWVYSPDCIQISESTCDLSIHLMPWDSTYTADIKTEPAEADYDSDVEDFPHTYSPEFNPYKESNISAVKFTVVAVDENRVIVNITDPVTTIHLPGQQLTIRSILKNDLKYKIRYFKFGSTGKRDIISDSSVAEVSGLDAGERYCFMVAAFIPTRSKANQQGPWGSQFCTHENLQDLSLEAKVGIVFTLLTVLIVVIVAIVLCRRCRRQRNKTLQTSQSSAPV